MRSNNNNVLERKLNLVAWIFSVVVFLLVLFMRKIKLDLGLDLSFLPAVYSTLNFITFCFLLIGFYKIRYEKNVIGHQRFMTLSVLLSGAFLVLYVLYHITSPETSFCREGWIRPVYYFLLITHIVLAAVILPFILFTYIRAFTNQFARHKKMARWVLPLWLYVALTGPVIYLLLLPCY